VSLSSVKRYVNKAERGESLASKKRPGSAPKLDEKARRLLVEDLEGRPWATHSQRAEFLFATCGVRVSEATVCRTLKRLSHSRKKGPRGPRNGTSS
jgi:transposase